MPARTRSLQLAGRRESMPMRHRKTASETLLVARTIIVVGFGINAFLVATAVAAEATTTPSDSNWPQWRGPLGSGAAPSADPPTTWGEGRNVRWKVKLPGRGTATPIIWGDSIFIQT